MSTPSQTPFKTLSLIALFLLAACRQGPLPTATSSPSVTPLPSVTPANLTATAAAVNVRGVLISAANQRVLFFDSNGQERPLDEAPETLYVLAPSDLTGILDGGRMAYAVGPQGARHLDFIESIGQGFAAYQPVNAAGKLAWDNWANNPDTGKVDSQIFTSGLDGSQARAVLRDSGDKVLRVVHWSADGQRLFFSRESLGPGGFIHFPGYFDGYSNLWELKLADGSSREIVPDALDSAICLDDISPDETQVAHHCAPNVISVLSPAGGGLTQIQPPPEGPEATDFAVIGDARFSPDGSRLAYALARSAPSDLQLQGWVAVSQGMSGPARLIATSPADDFFSVWGWLDDQTLILQSRGGSWGVWLVGADGSNLRRLADGTMLGVVGQ
jgi:hypothetical protein